MNLAADPGQRPQGIHIRTILIVGLVTCGGPFDAKTGEYLDSIVVYAHLAGLAAK